MLSRTYAQLEIELQSWYPFVKFPLISPTMDEENDSVSYCRINHQTVMQSGLSVISWAFQTAFQLLNLIVISIVFVRLVPTMQRLHRLRILNREKARLAEFLEHSSLNNGSTDDPLRKLPVELSDYLLCKLDLPSVLAISQLNKSYHSLIYSNDHLWRSMIRTDYGGLDRTVTKNAYQVASPFMHAYKSRFLIRLYFTRLQGGGIAYGRSSNTTYSGILIDECANSLAIVTQLCVAVCRIVLASIFIPVLSVVSGLFGSEAASHQTSVQGLIGEISDRASDELDDISLVQDLWDACTTRQSSAEYRGSWSLFCGYTIVASLLALVELFVCMIFAVQWAIITSNNLIHDTLFHMHGVIRFFCGFTVDCLTSILLLAVQATMLTYPLILLFTNRQYLSFGIAEFSVQLVWILTAGVSYHELMTAYLKTMDRKVFSSFSTVICSLLQSLVWIPVYSGVAAWFALSRCISYLRAGL